MKVTGLNWLWVASLVSLGCGSSRAADSVVVTRSGSDEELRVIATTALRKALRESEAESGFVIVSEASTGRRLAAVGLRAPTATVAEGAEPIPALIDPASLAKPLIAAAALMQGVTTLDEVHDCGPGAAGYDRNERLTVGQMVIQSSNRCAEQIAKRLPRGAWWSGGCVDPQSLVDEYRAFANEGAGAANLQVRRILAQVVTEGTGRRALSPVYSTAGKTGSSAGGAACARDAQVASFLGFAPVDRPAIVVLVAINNPRVGPALGGRHAAPVFREVVESALPVLGVAPDRSSR